MKKFFLTVAGAALLTGCVAKSEYMKLQDDLGATKAELDKAKTALSELEPLKPQLDAKNAELQQASQELADAKSRLAELDAAQKQMEQSLKSELDQKTIKLEKLNDRLTVTFIDKILFDSGSARVKDSGKAALKKVADSLKDMSSHLVHVEGHTDDQAIGAATARYFPTNWELSTARATAVTRFLQDNGVPPARLYAVGGAMFHPVASNDTAQGRAENRRVEIVLTPVLAKKAPAAPQK
jgi:chemotaxis protein MotB